MRNARRALIGESRSRWLVSVLVATFAMGVMVSFQSTARTLNGMTKTEIKIDGMIMSTPAIVRDEKSDKTLIGFVRGDLESAVGIAGKRLDKFTSVDVYQESGKHVSAFPLLKNEKKNAPFLIAPAHQVVGVKGEFEVVDIEGRLNSLSAEGKATKRGAVHGQRGLLVWPPTRIDSKDGKEVGLILVSNDYGPLYASKNQVDVVDGEGRSLPGFPMLLDGWPKQHAPILDRVHQRFFIFVASTGSIEGFDVSRGRRLPGFPVKLRWVDDSLMPVSMAYYPIWNALVVTSGTSKIMKVDADTGKAFEIDVKNGGRLSSIAVAGDQMLVVDDEKAQLNQLDLAGQITKTLPLKWETYRESYAMEVVPTASSTRVLVFSVRRADSVAEIERLYEKYKTKESEKEINDYFRNSAKEQYGTSDFNALKDKDKKQLRMDMVDSKHGYLELWLGDQERLKQMDLWTQTGMDVVQLKGDALQLEYTDVTKGYHPDTGFSLSQAVFPAVELNAKAKLIRVALPMNFYDRAGENPRDAYQARLVMYQLAVP